MANTRQVESLLTEHLRYAPVTLLDDIINLVNELTNRAVDAVEEGILSADPAWLGFAPAAAPTDRGGADDTAGAQSSYPDARPEIEHGVHQLETLLEAAVDRNFDRLELYVLQNVLTVPEELAPWVRLGHYQDLSLPPPASDAASSTQPAPTAESLHALRRKLQETRKLNAALHAEKTRNAALLTQLHALLSPATSQPAPNSHSHPSPNQQQQHDGPFAFLTTTPAAKTLGIPPLTDVAAPSTTSAAGPGPLTTTTTFTLAQLPSLRALLASLRPHLASLPRAPPDGDGEGADAAAERRAYVERQARRALERRGLLRGDGDEVVAGAGRRIAGEEVRGVEAWVGSLSRHGRGGGEEEGG